MAIFAAIVTGAVAAMLPGAALAQAPIGPGTVELRWDQCYADGGSDFKTFACDTNTGVEALEFTATPGEDLPELNGIEGDVILLSSAPSLPSWWDFGGCRLSTSLSIDYSYIPPGSAGCHNVWQGAAAGGIGYFENDGGIPSQARIRFVAGLPGYRSVTNGENLLLFTLFIDHGRTTGTGSCAGCNVPMGIGFERVQLMEPTGYDSPMVLYPIDGTDSDFVSWQSQFATSRNYFYSSTGWHKSFTLDSPTETLHSTWGGVKSLYR